MKVTIGKNGVATLSLDIDGATAKQLTSYASRKALRITYTTKQVLLRDGESVYDFTRALSEAASKVMAEKYPGEEHTVDGEVVKSNPQILANDIYEDSVIVSAWGIGGDDGYKSRYFKLTYKRNDDGTFEIGEPVEVSSVTTYVPIAGVEKAEWDAAYMNDLPDAAFAVIKSGGGKDEDGKTKPRSLRMLPHHDESVTSPTDNGSVDEDHLRNALSRVEQEATDLSESERNSARAHLKAHAKSVLKDYEDESKEEKNVEKSNVIYCPLVIKSAEKHLVTGIVLEPEVVDGQGEIYSEDTVEKAAHNYMIGLQTDEVAEDGHKIGMEVQHKEFDKDIRVVESWLAPIDMDIADEDGSTFRVKRGTWLMTAKVQDEDVWKRVQKRELNGFSIRGPVMYEDLESA